MFFFPGIRGNPSSGFNPGIRESKGFFKPGIRESRGFLSNRESGNPQKNTTFYRESGNPKKAISNRESGNPEGFAAGRESGNPKALFQTGNPGIPRPQPKPGIRESPDRFINMLEFFLEPLPLGPTPNSFQILHFFSL